MRIINEAKNIGSLDQINKSDYKKALEIQNKIIETISDYLNGRIGPDKFRIVDFVDSLHKHVDFYIDNSKKDFNVKDLEKTFSDFSSKTNLMIKDVLGFCNIINKIIKDSGK